MPRQKWSKEIVVSAILELHRGGQKLSSEYIKDTNVPLYGGALKHWGGWRQAIEGAGLSYNDVRATRPNYQFWSKEIIVQTILSMHHEGKSLNSNHIQTKEMRLYGAAFKYFGGWSQAIAAAGLDYSKLRKKEPMQSWSKAAIVNEILRRHSEGLSIRGGDVSKEDSGFYHVAKRHFGKDGWAKARMLAGFSPVDPLPWTIWSKKTVIEEILRLYSEGVPLNTAALAGTYGYIRSAGEKFFGSWGKAIEAAGLDYLEICKTKPRGWWTKSRIITAIQSLDKQGVRLSSKAIQKSHGDIFATAIAKDKFGSWGQAVEAAGISYLKHCRTWSTKAWLRRMENAEYKAIIESKT